jgi:hypothetical protein
MIREKKKQTVVFAPAAAESFIKKIRVKAPPPLFFLKCLVSFSCEKFVAFTLLYPSSPSSLSSTSDTVAAS